MSADKNKDDVDSAKTGGAKTEGGSTGTSDIGSGPTGGASDTGTPGTGEYWNQGPASGTERPQGGGEVY